MGSARESLRAFRDVLANPGLRRLQGALAGSMLGSWAYVVALAVYAYDTGGATAVGLLGLARWGTAAVVNPWAGVLADRFPRRRVMVASDLSRAAMLAGAAAIALSHGAALAIYALSIGAAVASTPFRPAQAAITPILARTPEELIASNVTSSSIESVGMFGGPALGGILLAVSNPGTVFAATAATFLWSAFLVSRIRSGERAAEAVDERPPLLATMLGGFAATAREPGVRLLVGLFSAQTFVDGMLNVFMVVVALRVTDLGQGGVGWLNSAVGVGGVLGAVVAAARVGRRRLAGDFGVGMLLWGVPLAVVAACTPIRS